MVFNSFEFIFAFFPLLLLGYGMISCLCGKMAGKQKKEKIILFFLLVMSLMFYGWRYPSCVLLLLVSMAVNFLMAQRMEKQMRQEAVQIKATKEESGCVKAKQLLFIGVALNVAVLAGFKYLHLTAPGISFFTFSQLAFLVEVYRGTVKNVPVLEYGLYISFFPKLLQGPIVLPGEMLLQLKKLQPQKDWEQIYRNVFLFVLGLFKKVIIADTLGAAADFGYAAPSALNSGEALIVMLSYTLQLYFDFSGYCDMAMGVAGLLGFELPLNFNSPYKAKNIIEFWDRWHITLTKFFTKYLYIPLGGSRKGRARTYVNCLIVFFISGLWHGTGLQFVVWGMLHGVLNVLTRMYREWKKQRNIPDRLPKCISVLLTFLYVNAAWVFFRASSVKEALSLFQRIFQFDFGRINKNLANCFNLDEFWYVIKVLGLDSWKYGQYILMTLILAALLLLVFKAKTAVEYVKAAKPGVGNLVMMTVLFVWSVLALSGVSSFLYFNF